MSRSEDDYDMVNNGSSGENGQEVPTALPPALAKHFVPSVPYPWMDKAEHVHEARRLREGSLLYDKMLQDCGIEDHSSYPCSSFSVFQALLASIHSLQVPRHDRDALLYYLLLDLTLDDKAGGNDRSPEAAEKLESFVRQRGLPTWRVTLVAGLWEADHGLWEQSVRHLANPATCIPESYLPLILSHLRTAPAGMSAHWIIKLLEYTQTPLVTSLLRDAYIRARAEVDFSSAWFWVRNEEWNADFEQEAGGEGGGDATKEERKRLLRVLVESSLIPRPRRGALEALLTLPFDDVEHTLLTNTLLSPPAALPPTSYELLHDLLNLRLMSHGEYSAAIDLDKRVSSLHRDNAGEGSEERRAMIREMIGLLPDVQRRMLSMDDGSDARPNGTPTDLAMSWEPVERPSAPQADNVQHPTPRKNVPLSASAVLRTSSTPNIAIYQAVMSSNPASPVPPIFSPAIPAANRHHPSSRDSPRGPLLVSGNLSSPKAEALSPYGAQRRVDVVDTESPRQAPRVVSSSSALFRQVATAQMNAAGPSSQAAMERGSPGFSRPDDRGDATQAADRPSRRFRTFGGWSAEEEHTETPSKKGRAKDLEQQQDGGKDDTHDKAVQHTQKHVETADNEAELPGGYGWAEEDKPPQRPAKAPKPAAEAQKKTRRTRQASTQPVSPPQHVRRTPRRAAKADVQELTALPGAFPEAVEDSSAPARRTTRSRTGSHSETRPAPPTDDETKANRRAPKRPRAPPPAPSTDARRRTRQQSVASSVASETADESISSAPRRRSSRLASAAPTSPTISERSERPRRAVRDTSATPRQSGVRTRRQTAMNQ